MKENAIHNGTEETNKNVNENFIDMRKISKP